MAEPAVTPEAPAEEPDAPDVLTSRKASGSAPMRPGEGRLVEWVESLYTDAEQAKKDQCDPDSWEKNLDTYWGDQWPGAVPTFKPRIVVNEIKSLMLQELSDLVTTPLKVYVEKDKAKGERDKVVEQAIQAYWARNFVDLKVLEAALDGLIFPLGFLGTLWQPWQQQGQGEILTFARDPESVFPDPDGTNDDDLTYVVTRDVLDVTAIRRDFPETGGLVEPEAAYSTPWQQKPASGGPRSGAYTGPMYSQTPVGSVPGWKKARARVLTAVVEDDERVSEIQEIQGELKQQRRYKYPNRRMIIVANGRVLYDGDNPYHGAPILTRMALQPTGHAYWPKGSIVAEYAEVQRSANKSDSMVVENGMRLNGGTLIADADSGINPKTWANIPGQTLLVKPGSKAEIKYPPPMPPDMIQMGDRLRGMIRANFGYPMSRTGAGTKGNISAELSETEISQSMGLTRLRGRLLHQSVQRLVEMIFARMAQFYTTPRHLPFIQDNQWTPVPWVPIQEPSAYAVHVDEASFQVRSKTMMQRLYLALAKMNKMPTKRLLKMLEIPDSEEISEELKQELMLIAAAKMKVGKGKR